MVVDTVFLSWLMNRYAGLHNQPSAPPVMLHHLPRLLARYTGQSEQEKVALLLIDGLVIDGLGLDQWIVMRKVLYEQRPDIQLQENAVFAWIPTITWLIEAVLISSGSNSASLKAVTHSPSIFPFNIALHSTA